jgi:hypothetical protein
VPHGPNALGRTGWLIVAGALALLLAGVYLVASPDVLDRGQLLSYTSQEVWRVRLFGTVDVWVAKEAIHPLDAVNGVILATGAGMAAMGGLLSISVAPRLNRFFVLLSAGLAYLVADELLGLHETFGYNLNSLAGIPGVHSPEHVFFMLYVIPAVAFFIFYWDVILASRWGARLLGIGVLLFGQWIKPASSLALVGGVALVAVRHLSWSAAAASLRPDAAETRGDRSPPTRA